MFAGWSLRLLVVMIVYKGFLDPGRDHWEFGYEIGHLARSIDTGHGFANPYWGNTGRSALLCPVYPYLMACVFAVFGVYTKASAFVFLGLNSFLSTVTTLPIFFIARKTFDLRTAKLAAWAWALFPYAIYFSAATMWYHSFTGLLLASILLAALFLASSDQLGAWLAFGALFGFAALTNPVIVGVAPVLGGWLWIQLARQGKRALAATTVGLLAMVATILPWSVRNDLVLHQPIPFKDGFWMEVCVGNVNGSVELWDGTEQPSGATVERDRFEKLGEISYMAEKRRRAIGYIKNHPGKYAVRSLRHVVLMWTGFWSFNQQYLKQEPFDPDNIVFLTLLSILSLIGLYHGLREVQTKARTIAYVLVLLFFPVPYYLTHVDSGFRHPVDPLLTILACSAIARWFHRPAVVADAREKTEEEELVLG
jgi:4-amino-4-deoxy-L-arabinose transferase-like glycosyltransferase